MGKRKRILIISTAFPPQIGSGIRRLCAFVKHLPRLGWNPYVLARVPSPYDAQASEDRSLRIPGAAAVERTGFFDVRLMGRRLLSKATGRDATAQGVAGAETPAGAMKSSGLLWSFAQTFVFVPDTDIGWLRQAVKGGLSVIKTAGIDVILSSAPPFTAHLVARKLKRLTGRPWGADFRDPWSENPYRETGGLATARNWIDRTLERKVMRDADAILTVSGPLAEGFSRLGIPGLERKTSVLTNGFDPEEFAQVARRAPTKFTVTYTGTFYGASRSPAPFLECLSDLIQTGAVNPKRISIRILEAYSQDTTRLARAYRLSEVVEVRSGASHLEAAQEQVNAAVLLLVIRNDQAGLAEYTGKLFEYLGARRPILMLGPKKGVAAELIREANAGTVVDSCNPQEIKDAILKYYREFERTGDVTYSGKEDVIRRYEHPALAEKLAGILDSLVSR